MKLEVLGTGCAKCHALEEATRRAADQLGVAYTLEHVKDLRQIAAYGVMMTPALVVDGQVKLSGRVPADDELMGLLQQAKQ